MVTILPMAEPIPPVPTPSIADILAAEPYGVAIGTDTQTKEAIYTANVDKITRNLEDFLANAGIIEPLPEGAEPRHSSIHPKLRDGKLVVFHSTPNPVPPHQAVHRNVIETIFHSERRSALNVPRLVFDAMEKGDSSPQLMSILEQLDENRRKIMPGISEGKEFVWNSIWEDRKPEFPERKKLIGEFSAILEKTDADFHPKLQQLIADNKLISLGSDIAGIRGHNAPGVFHAGTVRSAVERNNLPHMQWLLSYQEETQKMGASANPMFLHAYEIDPMHVTADIMKDEAKLGGIAGATDEAVELFENRKLISERVRRKKRYGNSSKSYRRNKVP